MDASIYRACDNGHKEVVKLLLLDTRVNPSSMNNMSLRIAHKKGYKDIVDLLLLDGRVDGNVLNEIINEFIQ